jgi:hypothetical protein
LQLSGWRSVLVTPGAFFLVATIIFVSAFGLEALQLLTPDRHARLLDAQVKAAGGVCGIGIGQLAQLAFANPNQARRLIQFSLEGRPLDRIHLSVVA